MSCSVSSLAGCSDGGDIAGGVGFSARCERRLEREVGHGERGIGSKAHRGAAGRVSGLGGASEWPNRRRRAPGPKLGDDDDGGCSGPFWSRETSRRSREALRSSGARRGGEGVAVAARAARVSDGGAWPVVCERDGEGEGRWERSRRFQGVRGVAGASGRSQAGWEGGGGRGAWPRAPPSSFGAPGRVFPFVFLFLFLFNISATLLN